VEIYRRFESFVGIWTPQNVCWALRAPKAVFWHWTAACKPWCYKRAREKEVNSDVMVIVCFTLASSGPHDNRLGWRCRLGDLDDVIKIQKFYESKSRGFRFLRSKIAVSHWKLMSSISLPLVLLLKVALRAILQTKMCSLNSLVRFVVDFLWIYGTTSSRTSRKLWTCCGFCCLTCCMGLQLKLHSFDLL
jgi:hypothetical protein